MKQHLQTNKFFFISYILFFIFGIGIIVNFTKTEQMIWINSHHNPFFDVFFQIMTWLGEGSLFVILAIGLFFVRKDRALMVLASFLLSTLLSQFFKHYIFPEYLRPFAFFKGQNIDWYMVKGLEISRYNSFPSGHTTSAFAMFSLVTFFLKNKNWGYVCCLLAALIGYSRAYLFQHFPEDILAGSVLGLACSLVVYFFLNRDSLDTSR